MCVCVGKELLGHLHALILLKIIFKVQNEKTVCVSNIMIKFIPQ